MNFTILIILLMTSISSSYADDDTIEVLCSKALLSEMQGKGLVSNSSGICLQSLNDLPLVSIGLGSSVYSSGQSDGKSLGSNDQKVREISEILTGNNLDKTPFNVLGYADGQNNTIPEYTKTFLNDQKTFTKNDIRLNIKDQHTRGQILDLLKDVPEGQAINPVWGEGNKTSFKHDAGVNYVKNIDRVMSLVNNYYLALERAKKTCEQLVEVEKIQSCQSKISGFASPSTEISSKGQIRCDARRKAVLILNPGAEAAENLEPSKVQPNFRIPDEGESRRDMQVAASLDLLKKIMLDGGEANARSTIEKLASTCSGYKLGDGYNLNKQNLERMYEDIYRINSVNPNPELKKAVINGDYKKIKSLLLNKEEKNEYEKKLAEVLTYGRDQQQISDRLVVMRDNKKLKCIQKQVYDQNQRKVVVLKVPINHINYDVYDCEGTLIVKEFNHKNKSQIVKISYVNERIGYRHEKDKDGNLIPSSEFKYVDHKYPFASREKPSTDVFNCLSASKAIEEKLEDSNQTGAGGQIIDPSQFVAKDGHITVAIDPEKIGKHKDKNGAVSVGWMCSKCHSGIHVNKNDKYERVISKKTREYINTSASLDSESKAPISQMGLTFGSMKNLAFRKVTRESFGGQCPTNKKVCDCLKNVSHYGGLDKVLEKSAVINLNQKLESKMPFNELDQQESCLYTPPVAPACSVDPSGRGVENKNKGFESESCLALERFFKKYPERKAINEAKFKTPNDFLDSFEKIPLNSLLCKKVFPSENDAKDCGTGTPMTSPSQGKSSNRE